jgi:aconitate hydratase
MIDPKNTTFDDIIELHGATFRCVDVAAEFGPRFASLPWVLRVLFENVCRNLEGCERDGAIAALRGWLDQGRSEAEIPFLPGRILMHDTTCTPALVDIAAMRDTLANAGVDPAALHPVLPVDVSVDHSLAVEAFGTADAAHVNLAHELRRNAERYRFMRWAAASLHNVRIHPPGTGIMHTLNLEQLATVVNTVERDGHAWLVPDTMIGTDSHTPMINGIGVLGWGVGGLEAQTALFGMPTMLRIPDVIGVRLIGALPAGVMATDLALVVTQRLRALGVSGEFVEFFGLGVAQLRAEDRCVVANMAPEYGATTGYFAIDERTLDYLRATGRSALHVERVAQYAKRVGLWFDPDAAPRYTQQIEIDLGRVGLHVAGPARPQDLRTLAQVPEALQATVPTAQMCDADARRFPIAIAAITSCTNTSDPALLIAAGLVARKARALGLRVPAHVKTSLAPGSPAAAAYLRRSGLLDDLEALGFSIVGYGCTTCIGNSGPLTPPIAASLSAPNVYPVNVLSGNRNFPGRVHPALSRSLIMSPALVVAFALCDDACVDLSAAPVAVRATGEPVFLSALWPTREEIESHLRRAVDVADYSRAFSIASHNSGWDALVTPSSPQFPWNPQSTILKPPPFAAREAGSLLGAFTAYPLLVLGDDVTTDHISPASAIPPDSPTADFLVARGESRDDLNVFASRRGHWEVMVRAAFFSHTLRNHLHASLNVGQTVYLPTGEVMSIVDAANCYVASNQSVVIVAGERYGTGSSRDWAAKGPRLLGVRAVVAQSFERIHRTNLIGMGIAPVRIHTALFNTLQTGEQLQINLSPERLRLRGAVDVRVQRTDGTTQVIEATLAVETQRELDLLRSGGVIPTILARALNARAVPTAQMAHSRG